MISCLTITQAGRSDILARAVADFARQTFAERELLIVHDGGAAFDAEVQVLAAANPAAPIRVFSAPPGLSLGALRNLSVDQAAGDYVCQWDDDDRYHPQRLEIQWQALHKENAEFCFLCDQLHLFADDARLFWDDWNNDAYPMNFIQGTLLGRKELMPRYPDARRGEDTDLMLQLLRAGHPIARVRDAGWAYVYVFHGGNAWEKQHHAAIAQAKGLSPARLLAREAVLRKRLPEYQPPLGALEMPCGNGVIRFP